MDSSIQSFQLQEKPFTLSSDSLKEYDAVRHRIGLFNFSSFGKIEIRGNDRVKFLQGLTTNDILGLSDGKGLYTIIPTIKGKIASEATVFFFPEKLLLIVPPDLREKTLQILNRYKIGSDAKIEDVTEKISLFSVQGPNAEFLFHDMLQQSLPPLPPLHYLATRVDDILFYLIRNGWSGETGVDLLVSAQESARLWDILLNKGKNSGITPVGAEAFEALRIEAGVPLYGKELSEDILPQEAGLEPRAISYTKGCYIGQETIARLHYLGHTNRSLVGLLIDGDIPLKDDKIISGGKILGAVTSAIFSPSLKRIIAMAYLHRQYISPGTKVEIEHQGKTLQAEVTELPFYRSEKREKA